MSEHDELPKVPRLRARMEHLEGDVPVGNELYDELVAGLPPDRPVPSERGYPYPDGDTTVLGPQVFVSSDERVINWRGQNYYRDIPRQA